ncbi:max-binding protein MNT-like [Penaeus japonicus]|uniref:max-binding protein MNT-like n=1 Tax=Penaeus japonicus TaxID=27405 RepID=UPI001C713DBB|nr:max-binding protein MNT-like [Penaeus japonicus]
MREESATSSKSDSGGSRAAQSRIRQYKEREREKRNAELDRLCAAAHAAHTGLRMYMLITTPPAPKPSPPTPKVVPLLSDRGGWMKPR